MKLLIDIGHPAHVHLFKNTAFSLMEKGWEVLFTVRRKGENVGLLQQYGLPFIVYGESNKSPLTKICSVWHKNRALYRIIRSFNPTITISHSSFYLSQVSWYCNIPNITLEDTGNMEQILLYLPFTDCILTPQSYHREHGKKQVRYKGFHETAYIHPDYLKQQTEEDILKRNTILIRMVDWTASHDIGHKGLTVDFVEQIIASFTSLAQVKIIAERALPFSLAHYELTVPCHKLHEFLSDEVMLYIGDGATLASECALMGIPSIYVNSRKAGVISAQEDEGLIFNFKLSEHALAKAGELIASSELKIKHYRKARNFLKDKINLSKYLVELLLNYR